MHQLMILRADNFRKCWVICCAGIDRLISVKSSPPCYSRAFFVECSRVHVQVEESFLHGVFSSAAQLWPNHQSIQEHSASNSELPVPLPLVVQFSLWGSILDRHKTGVDFDDFVIYILMLLMFVPYEKSFTGEKFRIKFWLGMA